MLNSYPRKSPQQNMSFNETKNSSILHPEITSTPLYSPNRSRAPSPLVTPTRRFVGPRRYALSSNGMLSPLKTIQNPPGPLLTSTSYNVNVSTYIDSKSPGYAGRLVQYNEENSRNHQHTHQEKYGSPGLFPIVHLFKKNIPVISPKPKKGTLRIGTPEVKCQFSQEHNRVLLEGIVRNTSVIKDHNHTNEGSTRSVLDALKEISRKRIHASEEYEVVDESNKKLRRDCINSEVDTSKRNRGDSPTSDTSASPPARQAMKKLCTVDAILASKTSSMYANNDTVGTKRKTVDTKTKVSPVNKKVFTNAETQTSSTSTNSAAAKENTISTETNTQAEQEKEQEKEEDHLINSSVQEEETPAPKQVLKVFDDKPLEIIRKNRLGALLSALTGHEIPPIPMEDRRKALDQDWPPHNSEKKLVSILSPTNKQPHSVQKHVTFCLPDNSAQSSSSESLSASNLSEQKTTELLTETLQPNSGATSLTSHSSKSGINEISQKNVTSVPQIEGAKLNPTLPINNPTTVGGFKFDLTKPITSSSIDSTEQSDTKKSSTDPNVVLSSAATSNVSFTSSSPVPKFGIPSPKVNTTSPLSLKTSFENNLLSKTLSSSPMTNSLGLPTSLPQPTVGENLCVPITSMDKTVVPNTIGKSTPTFSFGNRESNKPSGFGNSMVPNASSPSTTPLNFTPNSAPSFNTSTTASSSAPLLFSTENAKSTINFGTSTATTAPPYTAIPSLSAITSASSNFAVSPTSLSFGAPGSKNLFPTSAPKHLGDVPSTSPNSSLPNFGNAITSPSGFNFTSGKSLPAFGSMSKTPGFAPATSSIPTDGTFGAFQNSEMAISLGSTKATSFGTAPATISSFGTPATTNLLFGTTTTTISFETHPAIKNTFSTDTKTFAFGSDKQNFGHSSTSVSTTPMFTIKDQQSGMNQNFANTLPSTNTTSMFTLKNSQSGMTLGTNTSASTASNIQFGSSAPTFGGVSSNMFPSTGGRTFGQNTTTVSSFGTSSTPSFGVGTTSPAFGPSNTPNFGASNSAVPTFGKSSTPNFGTPASSVFGTTNAPTFGTTNAVSFGTTNAPTFGTTSAPTFGTTIAPSFGTTNAPTFGTTNAPTFGTTNAPTFGTTNAPTFGTTNAPAFGTTNAPTFGTTNAPTFGTTNASSFGAPNAPTFGTTIAPTFGTTNASSFGTTNAPTFGTTNAPTFGTTNIPTFGTTNTTASGFGTTNTINFGAPISSAPTFGTKTPSFGASTTSSTFGSTNTPSFGNPTTASAFGTVNTPSFGSSSAFNTPNFGAPSTTSGNTFSSNNNTPVFGNSAGTSSFNNFGSTSSPFNPTTTASSFGTNANNTFGTSNSTFGSSTNGTMNNSFGSGNTASSPFASMPNSGTSGNNVTCSGTFGSGFGNGASKSGPPSNIFSGPGQNNMFGNSSTFGSAQTGNNLNPGSSTGGVFTFGSPNAQSSSSTGVFAFGASEPPKTFNFSAPGTSGSALAPANNGFPAASTFGQPAAAMQSMFSIGSGASSAQSRSRPVARARRRN